MTSPNRIAISSSDFPIERRQSVSVCGGSKEVITFGLREEEENNDEVHKVQANEHEVVLPVDGGDGKIRYLGEQHVERPICALISESLAGVPG